MDNFGVAIAKLAGIKSALTGLLEDMDIRFRGGRPYGQFSKGQVEHLALGAKRQIDVLAIESPALFGDFHFPATSPGVTAETASGPVPQYSRKQLIGFASAIDQAFTIRAHSQLQSPDQPDALRRVFISHGRNSAWRQVQAYIEKDLKIATLELAQEANLGRTVIDKLQGESAKCDVAVIVMTGDDTDGAGNARARENVIHEIGFFQGKMGTGRVVLLYEEGVSIPSNIHGVVYSPFPPGVIEACLALLGRELQAIYRSSP